MHSIGLTGGMTGSLMSGTVLGRYRQPMTPEMEARIEKARENLRDQPPLTYEEAQLAVRLMGRPKAK